MFVKGLVCAIVFFIANIAFAQRSLFVDSARRVLKTKNLSAKDKLRAYEKIAAFSPSMQERIEIGEKQTKFAVSKGNKFYEMSSYLNIGVAYRYKGDLDIALKFLFKSAEMCVGIDTLRKQLGVVYSEISTCYTQQGNVDNAMLYGRKSINTVSAIEDDRVLAVSLLNYGFDLYIVGRYDSSIHYYNLAKNVMDKAKYPYGAFYYYLTGNEALVRWKRGSGSVGEVK